MLTWVKVPKTRSEINIKTTPISQSSKILLHHRSYSHFIGFSKIHFIDSMAVFESAMLIICTSVKMSPQYVGYLIYH